MRIDEDGTIWFRQSWIGTFHICPERGRLKLVLPEWDEKTSDSAAIGTITHAAIETILLGGTFEEANVMMVKTLQEILDEGIKWTKYDEDSVLHHARRCFNLWSTDISPHVPLGGHAEWQFQFRIPDTRIGFEGTVDYIDPNGVVWDWKTTSDMRRFMRWEKQRYSPQATVYTAAAAHANLTSHPTEFKYGVMGLKGVTDIVTITRHEVHLPWLVRQMADVVTLAERMGVTDNPWPTIDDHALCSEQWCPWWSICKGAHLTHTDNITTIGA